MLCSAAAVVEQLAVSDEEEGATGLQQVEDHEALHQHLQVEADLHQTPHLRQSGQVFTFLFVPPGSAGPSGAQQTPSPPPLSPPPPASSSSPPQGEAANHSLIVVFILSKVVLRSGNVRRFALIR